jgi:hypothetical protein
VQLYLQNSREYFLAAVKPVGVFFDCRKTRGNSPFRLYLLILEKGENHALLDRSRYWQQVNNASEKKTSHCIKKNGKSQRDHR